jgi:hypothetical protein
MVRTSEAKFIAVEHHVRHEVTLLQTGERRLWKFRTIATMLRLQTNNPLEINELEMFRPDQPRIEIAAH